jgi:hypothetical protein
LLTPQLWRWRQYFPPKRRWTSTGLNALTPQKTVLFIVTAVRTSNPTKFITVPSLKKAQQKDLDRH